MTDYRTKAVVWYPGCFGQFVLAILKLQNNHFDYDLNDPSSHDIMRALHSSEFKRIHGKNPTEEETKTYRNIFPYFPNQYRFLPKIFHYMKFFKDLPTEKNYKKFDIKDFFIACHHRKEFFYKTIVTHFWLYKVDIPKNVYILDMTELFLDMHKFTLTLESVLQQKLLKRTKEFIARKQELNLPMFEKYVDLVLKLKVSVFFEGKQQVKTSEDFFKCLLLAEIIDYKQDLYNKFLNNYKGQELTTTNDIKKIFV